MKSIHAKPERVREIFGKEYIIPEYQRPYSWTEDQCDQLWEDITAFYEESKEESGDSSKYFLGNIVIYDTEKDHVFVVVDGQQRLISLQLLIKALYGHAKTYHTLHQLLKKSNPRNGEIINEPRIESRAIDDDNDALRAIIIDNNKIEDSKNPRFQENYKLFRKWIEEWCGADTQKDLKSLIDSILDNVVLLPIHCDSEDDAQTLFQTINDRGLSLSDVDIFKSILYRKASDREKFMGDWKYLSQGSEDSREHEREYGGLFRIQMHISRAQDRDISKEQGLRSYFKRKKKLEDHYSEIMEGLKRSHDIRHKWYEYPEADAWWSILDAYPNSYWQFPLLVFLHKYGNLNADGQYEIQEDHKKDYLVLIQETVKYFYTVGVARNTINAVRDTTFKVCRAIEHRENYAREYFSNEQWQRHTEEFENKMGISSYGRYLKGLVLIGAYLHQGQQKRCKEYYEFLDSGYHIEHILPKNWNHYDGWDQDSHGMDLNKLGNLVPLEYKLNIAARNSFFDRKKEKYAMSVVRDAKDLVRFDNWTPERLTTRDGEIKKRIFDFFIPQ